MSERVPAQNKNSATPSQTTQQSSPLFQQRPFTDERYESFGSNSNISKELEGIQPKTIRRSLNWQNIAIEAPSRSDGMSLPGGIQRQQEQPAPAIGHQVAADSAQKSALELSNSTISTDEQAQQPKIARARFDWRNISVEAPSRTGGDASPQPIQRQQETDPKEEKSAEESGNSTISTDAEAQKPKIARAGFNWRNISIEAPSRSGGEAFAGAIQRASEEEKKDIDLKPEAPAIGRQVSGSTEEKSAEESGNSTISTDGQAQQPKIARASFNWRNISIEAPSRGGASSTYPGGIQRQETSDEKEGEESNESLQMQSEGAIQAKCSECEQEEKEEQNNESIQTKLTVGAPGDKYEQEADSMAAKVMTMPDSAIKQPIQRQTEEETEAVQMQPLVNSITPLVQRSSGDEEEVQMKSGLQRASDGSSQASPSVENRLAGSKGGGSALPDDVRSFMEPRFGADFSSVRVHTDSTAVQMNKDLGAQAFAHGSDIYFGAGKSPGKNELTAHELTHTIQQGAAVRRKPKPEEEEKQPLQAKKLSSKTPEIQNKLATGVGAQIQAKADPGQILEQLKNTPPTSAPAAYGQAQAASAGALEAQKQQLQQSLPKIPAPTGLPAQKSGSKEAKGKGTAAAGNKETPATGAKQKSGQAAKGSKIQVKEAPPPRPIKATQLAGGNVGKPPAAGNGGAKSEQAGQSDPQLARSAQNELASVRLDSSQVSTKLGKAPTVDMTGDADPAQMDLEQRQSKEQVSKKKAEAAKEINQDFGENNIFPEDSKETLQASKALSAAKAPGGNKGKVPVVPGEVAGQLNQSLAPALKERIGAEQQKYTVGKQKFDKDTAKAKTDSDKEIAKLNQETKQKQLKEQQLAKSEVQASKQEWQTELTKAEKDYQDKAGKATQDQKKKIDQEKQKGEQEASKHIAEAEKKAEQEKQKAEKEADQKKGESEKESGGFLGWVKSAATAVIDGLKKAVNFIYDNLRKAVKFIFEQAIKLATAVIDLARKAIVGLIQGLGTILKGLVNVVFAAFPEIAKKINSKIDKAIKAAVKAVNAAADLLKKGVKAALDFLAKALDTLLAGIQALYNAAFDAIGKVIEALRKLLEGLGNLVAAAKQMPGHFMGQLSEEVLGMNLTEPLPFERSKEDCAKCDAPATAKGGEATAKGGDDKAALLNKTQFAEDDFALDSVAPFDVDPEFIASLNLQQGGDVEFGESNDPANSMEAIKAELAGGETEGNAPAGAAAGGEKAVGGCCDDEQTAEAKLQEMMAQKPEGAEGTQKQGKPAQQGDIPANMKTIGPLSVGQRAKYMSHQMIQGVKQWFSANWPKLLAGAIAALAAFVGLNILTGGAIMAALPALMQVVAVVMGGVALANIAGHIGNYLSQGWAGNIGGAAKSLARGLAAGAVELVFALLFNAGAVIKAIKGGLKGTAKAATGAAKNTVKATVKSVKELGQIGAKGAKTALKNGKIMLSGVKGGFAKGAKSLDDLASRLVGKLRFNKFKIRRQGFRIQLLGHINPWVLLADGSVEFVESTKLPKGSRRPKVGEVVKVNEQDAIVVGIRNVASKDVEGLQEVLPRLQQVVEGKAGSQKFLYLHELLGSKGLRNLATKTDDEILAAFKTAEVAAQNPRLRRLLIERPALFEKLAKNPEAVNTLQQALDDVSKEGAENLASVGTRTPKDTPLTPNQRQISEEIQTTLPREKPTQPGYDPQLSRDEYLDELYRQAKEADQELRPLTERLAEITGGKPGFRKGLKGRERSLDKVLEYEKEGANASRLVDIAGSKIVFNSLDDLYAALDQIRREIESLPTIDIAQIKDRFIKPQGSGYRDILMNLKMTNKHIAEFRLHLQQFDEVAAIEHDLYDVIRTMETLAEQASRALTTQETAIEAAIKRQTQQMYDDALKRALGENPR
ncbi:eCIS core domain-containing protein [Microseira wollei]|uniref:OmpA/MotB domain-containing protein n=1 Tax=Microseira wollei NIES-4236 TaxID=2530354 RepID=A0AAV3X1Z6_9CYAN|nr:DUF4157 domain-containing protein [Microseira wollei]GET35958.1 OmpA/MotB domain-containing protein [Microseira wollei NIES-4236]